MFFRKKIPERKYDSSVKKPAIRASICTGEKVAGFIDLKTRHFEEVMLIRNSSDLDAFRRQYGIEEELETIY